MSEIQKYEASIFMAFFIAYSKESIDVKFVLNTTNAAAVMLFLLRSPTLLQKHVLCQSNSHALDKSLRRQLNND